MADRTKLIADLKQKLENVPPLEDERDFTQDPETLACFLKARDWSLEESEKLIRVAIEWRRKNRPLKVDCQYCHQSPGFHSMRQIGHDVQGRPVIYASFTQSSSHRNTAEDSVTHIVYLVENAKRTMAPGVTQWVWVMDCSGMTLPACNPRLGYNVTQILSDIYPERLGMIICVNHSSMFHGVWKAIKVFLHPNTVAKMNLLKTQKKMNDCFRKYFSPEMCKWLNNEIELNRKSLTIDQKEFWKSPKDPFAHDPRGCPSYVEEYIDMFPIGVKKDKHHPHPNVVDYLSGKDIHAPSPSESPPIQHATTTEISCTTASDSESESIFLELPEKYKINDRTLTSQPMNELVIGGLTTKP